MNSVDLQHAADRLVDLLFFRGGQGLWVLTRVVVHDAHDAACHVSVVPLEAQLGGYAALVLLWRHESRRIDQSAWRAQAQWGRRQSE